MSVVGKGVVCVKDMLNFIVNCVGIFLIFVVIIEVVKFGLCFDEVDDLMGSCFGCVKLVMFCIVDVVGFDMMVYVIKMM